MNALDLLIADHNRVRGLFTRFQTAIDAGQTDEAATLADVGFTIPANGMAYWVGEAMGSTDLKDRDGFPEKVAAMVSTAVTNGVHLTRLLQRDPYPAPSARADGPVRLSAPRECPSSPRTRGRGQSRSGIQQV